MNCRDAEALFSPDQKRRYQELVTAHEEYNEYGYGANGLHGFRDFDYELTILSGLNELCAEVDLF